jgi:drug/metabolite transporter (DMT)-like permease
MVQPRPGLGYAMVAVAATLFAVNGTVSKVILGSGISSGQLTAVRCACALLGLTLIAVATRPGSLRVHTDDLPLLIALGIGLAVVQWSYFFAIHRLDIGILRHISATRGGITAMLKLSWPSSWPGPGSGSLSSRSSCPGRLLPCSGSD